MKRRRIKETEEGTEKSDVRDRLRLVPWKLKKR